MTTEDGKYSASCNVKVVIPVTSVSLNKTSLTLNKGKTATLTSTISPSDATNKKVRWSSSNTSVATVDSNGLVKAINAGSSTITVTSDDGKYSASCNVKVIIPYVEPTSNRIAYKTNFSATRTGAVMQSWIVYKNYLYVTQRNGSIDVSKHYPAGFITRIAKSAITNSKYTVFTAAKYNEYVHLEKFGHMGSIAVEETDGISYLWTGCNAVESDKYDVPTNFCRIPLSDVSFNGKLYKSTYGAVYNTYSSNAIAIDNNKRILVLRSGGRGESVYTVYDLDDYIKNGKKGGDGATAKYSFKVVNKTLKMENGKSKTDISWQGFAIYNNYVYIYEGNAQKDAKENEKTSGVFVSIWSIKGEKVIYRKNIGYPGKEDWEPEGIQVYKNLDGVSGAYIYIGFSNKDTTPRRHYIYRLGK